MPDPACQSKSLGFETKLGQPYGTVRSVGPVRGGLGYRWLVSPTEPYPSKRSGLDYLGSNSCTLFINYLDINNIDKTQNYI